MAFWNGALWLGALKGRALIRLTLDVHRVTSEQRVEMKERIRDLRAIPYGEKGSMLYVITDGSHANLLRIWPAPIDKISDR